MQSIIESIREVLGVPQFYMDSGVLDYGAVTEYFVGALILCIVIGSIFKCIVNFSK